MAPAQDAAGLLYDPADPRYRIDPYPLYARLREADPVHWSPLGFWVLTRYADVDCVHRDPRCGRGLQPDDGMVATWGGPSSPITAELGGWMLHKDGPDHTRLRRLVGKVFHPAAVRSLRVRIQGIVDGLLDQVVETGTMDVIADLALPPGRRYQRAAGPTRRRPCGENIFLRGVTALPISFTPGRSHRWVPRWSTLDRSTSGCTSAATFVPGRLASPVPFASGNQSRSCSVSLGVHGVVAQRAVRHCGGSARPELNYGWRMSWSRRAIRQLKRQQRRWPPRLPCR